MAKGTLSIAGADTLTAAAAAGNIYVGAGETWYARLTSTLSGSIHAISSASTVTCIVCAMFDDVSV